MKKRITVLLCIFVLLLSACGGRTAASVSTEAAPSEAGGASLSVFVPQAPEPQVPEETPPCVMVNGTQYLLSDEGYDWMDPQNDPAYRPYCTISVVVEEPAADGEANFGAAGETLYRLDQPDFPDDFTLYYRANGLTWTLYPTECVALDRALTAEEELYAGNVQALAQALEQRDLAALTALMETTSEKTAVYASPLAKTELSVTRIVYALEQTSKFYGHYTGWLDVVVSSPDGLLPEGEHRLVASFSNDPRRGHAEDTLPLVALAVRQLSAQTPNGAGVGWELVDTMVTYRIDKTFERPEDIDQRLLLRVVVPYAYRREVMQGRSGNVVLTPELVAESAQLLFGIEGFDVRHPDYFDEASGNYTLRNHSTITAGMGSAMDYIDEGLNCSFTWEEDERYTTVTVTHYFDPLRLLPSRILEYTVEKVTDPLTQEQIGRVLSARQIY